MGDATFAWGMPGGALAVALACAVAIVVAGLGIREAAGVVDVRRRRVLMGLRVVTVLVAVALATQPTWTRARVERTGGSLLVLVDASESMRVRGGEGTRWEDAVRLASRAAEAPGLDVAFGTVGDGYRPTTASALTGAARPVDRTSRLLADVTAAAETPGVGAVLLLSDGADRTPSRAWAALEATGVKVHAALLGAPPAFRDDAIVGVRADTTAFLRQEATAEVTLRTTLDAGASLRVTLLEGGAVVAAERVTAGADGTAQANLRFSPSRLGRAVYTVALEGAADDEVPENNRAAFLVDVRRDRLRVLHVAGRPSWDERFLRSLLKRDTSLDLVSFFILRSATDLTQAPTRELALIPFPTDELFSEHLGSFDLVILQNFNYGPYQMAAYLPGIREFVRRGGALAMVGGDLGFGAAGYGETPLADILPVTLPVASDPEDLQYIAGPRQVRVVDGFARHPLVALRPDAAQSAELWRGLAPIDGANRVTGLAEGAAVLLEHGAPGGASGGASGAEPLLVLSRAGRGRVLALLTDGSWRWGIATGGKTGDASAHAAFWDRALRWLAADPSMEPSWVVAEPVRVRPGTEVRVHGALRDAWHAPIRGEVPWVMEALEGASGGRALAQGALVPDAEGRVAFSVRAPETPGVVRVVVGTDAEVAVAESAFVVEAGADELADLWPDRAFMERIAKTTGGSFHGRPAEVPALAALDTTRERVLGTTEERPFATGWAFLFALAAWGAEWGLRRRWGLR